LALVLWGGTATVATPNTLPKYSNHWPKADHAASEMDLASFLFLTMFGTIKSS
jgi:hypothetical protein